MEVADQQRRLLELCAIRVDGVSVDWSLIARQAQDPSGLDDLFGGVITEKSAAATRSRPVLTAGLHRLPALAERVSAELEAASGAGARLVTVFDRAYPANQLSWWNKVGIYFSRWWEFLSAEPRAGNFEGGVFPAIWGTAVMTILLPDKGQFAAFEEKLPAQLASLLANLNSQAVTVSLPRFRNESVFDLTQALKKLGMSTALSESADFSGMTGQRDLSISAVVHKAFVEVNEKGTEAAAVMAVPLGPPLSDVNAIRTIPFIPKFRADKPFVFLICDTHSGAILFIGRVVNPKP